MLYIAICDDDLDFAARLMKQLKRGFSDKGIICRIDVYGNADDLAQVSNIEGMYYDIVCLDIQISGQSGIDIGNSIRDKQKNQKSQIVFVSNYSSYHESGQLYDSAPMAFIKKPCKDADIQNIVSKAINRIMLLEKDNRYFTFEYDRQKFNVPTRDIICIQCHLRTKKIHTVKKVFLFNSSMKQVINAIDNPDFVLVHASFLVNLSFVESISSKGITFTNGFKMDNNALVPVSVKQYKEACWAVDQFVERRKQKEKQNV